MESVCKNDVVQGEDSGDCAGLLAGVETRWMIRRDTDEVLDIEDECFAEPWCEDDLTSQMRRQDTIGLVVEHGGQVVGYVVYRIHRDHYEIVRLGVGFDFRSMGVGMAIIRKLIGKLSPTRRESISTMVHESNVIAQVFFRSMGFAAEAVSGDPGNDEYHMVYRLSGFHEWQGRI